MFQRAGRPAKVECAVEIFRDFVHIQISEADIIELLLVRADFGTPHVNEAGCKLTGPASRGCGIAWKIRGQDLTPVLCKQARQRLAAATEPDARSSRSEHAGTVEHLGNIAQLPNFSVIDWAYSDLGTPKRYPGAFHIGLGTELCAQSCCRRLGRHRPGLAIRQEPGQFVAQCLDVEEGPLVIAQPIFMEPLVPPLCDTSPHPPDRPGQCRASFTTRDRSDHGDLLY